jgi:hypothetical protein
VVGRRRCGHWGRYLLLVCLCATAVCAVPGCSGCRRDPEAEKKKKEEEEKKKKEEAAKRKPNFEFRRLRLQPYDDKVVLTQGKWGHWVSAARPVRANNFDFRGELFSATVHGTASVPLELDKTPFRVRMSRPVALPKGQAKHVESTYFVPRPANGGKNISLYSQLRWRRGGREEYRDAEPLRPMAAHQYDLVVLARRVDSYAFLKQIHSVKPPQDSFITERVAPYYRVLLPVVTEKRRLPLPSQPLFWSTIAYLVWDDIDPDKISLDQQQAMVDWLHWGGQIIVSGPASLDSMRGTFLKDYLPAEAGDSVELTPASFDVLNEEFSLKERRGGFEERYLLNVDVDRPVQGIEFQKHDDARFVPGTGELLVERRVGRGRIVATAFPLTDRRVTNWRNFDNFFNACLLRRPPRRFGAVGQDLGVQVNWAEHQDKRLDARLVTNVRYFTRDTGMLMLGPRWSGQPVAGQPFSGAPGETLPVEGDVESPYVSGSGMPIDVPMPAEAQLRGNDRGWDFESAALFDNGFEPSRQSGVGGWDDVGATPSAVRIALKDAAGIEVPSAEFVLQVLGVYLLVLVPLNWLVFRVIGRVEWAWLAAPVIAVGGAVLVVYLAQLDIGFVRSRTEIGVLEVQGGYHRAHLTRYTALYTSLSKSYDLNFEDPSALALPFVVDPQYRPKIGQSVHDVRLVRDQKVRLLDFPIASTTTRMVHSEQMFALGGGLRLVDADDGSFQVANETDLMLHGAGVIRRARGQKNGVIEVAWIGEMEPGQTSVFRFQRADQGLTLLPQWDDAPETALRAERGQLSLRRLLDLAQDPRRVGVGDIRLIAWTDAPLKGLDIRPRASQERHRALVIAHLRYGPWKEPRPDRNTVREFRDGNDPEDGNDEIRF